MLDPKIGLSQDKHMSVLKYGLFHENVTLTYFVFLGDPVISSVHKCGLFHNLWLSCDSCGLFQLAERDTPHNAVTF